MRPASVGASPAHLPSAFLGYPEIARGTPGPMEENAIKMRASSWLLAPSTKSGDPHEQVMKAQFWPTSKAS